MLEINNYINSLSISEKIVLDNLSKIHLYINHKDGIYYKKDDKNKDENKENIKLFNTMRNDIKHIQSKQQYNKFVTEINNKNNTNSDGNGKNQINIDKLYLICTDCLELLKIFISSNQYDTDSIYFDTNHDDDDDDEINNNNNNNSNLFQFLNDNNYNKYYSLIIKAKKEINEEPLKKFSFGEEFFYWTYFSNRGDKYIKKPKYKCLKEELLSNNICKMTLNTFNLTLNKAFYNKNCQKGKQLKSSRKREV